MSLRHRIRLPQAVVALSAFALLLAGTAAFAQVAYDAQIPFSFTTPTLYGPAGVAVAPDGTVYVVDTHTTTGKNGTTTVSLVRITPTGMVGSGRHNAADLAATGATLTYTGESKPTALVVDSTGVLYVADAGAGKVFKIASPESSTNPTASTISYGGTDPVALAVDSANNLYIADETAGNIYKAGTATAIVTGYKPVGLAVDSAGDVYFADAGTSDIYKYSAGATSTFLAASGGTDFNFSVLPVGMGVDPAGDLYVMDSGNDRIVEATSSTNSFSIPINQTTPTTNDPLAPVVSQPGSLALSSTGNIYLTDDSNDAVDELYYNNNPVNFGSLAAGTASPEVTLNFYFVSAESSVAYYQSVQGDDTGEFSNPGASGSACGETGRGENVSAGTLCSFLTEATYLAGTPGLRLGADGLSYASGTSTTYAAVPSEAIDLAGSLALYPGTQSVLSSSATLYEPQAVAVSGDGGWLFVADEGGQLNTTTNTYSYPHPAVWAYQVANGGSGTQLGTPSNAANQVGGALSNFTNPIGLALDAAGNLYVADYSGFVRKISPAGNWDSAGTNLALPAGTLNHPISIAIDPSGNIYIGDAGPLGSEATAANPGYIVEVPADGGPAVKLSYTVGGTPVIYPEGLTTDVYGNLYIADGGDFANQSNTGGVDVVTASTGAIAAVSFGSYGYNGKPDSLNEPGSLSFDAAGDLYVLDSYNQRILVIPVSYSGSTPAPQSGDVSTLGYGSSGISNLLVTPSSMVVWPGGQNITIADIGFTPSSGPSSAPQVITLQAYDASVVVSTGSGSLTGINVGNQEITFNSPSITGSGTGHVFSVADGSGDCGADHSTISPGIVNACSVTIDYAGSGTHTGTVTMKGNTGDDNSALGNVITAYATPEQPVAQITASGLSDFSVTVTIENIGADPLIITDVELDNATHAILNGTTCTLGASGALQIDKSCTATVTFDSGYFFGEYTGDLVFTDNNGGTVGSTQTECVYDYFGFLGGASSGACGGGFGADSVGPANGIGGIGSLNVPNSGRANIGAGNGAPNSQPEDNVQQPVSTIQTGNTPRASGNYLPLGFVAPSFSASDNSADQDSTSNEDSSTTNDDSASSDQSGNRNGKKSHKSDSANSGGNTNSNGSGDSVPQQ